MPVLPVTHVDSVELDLAQLPPSPLTAATLILTQDVIGGVPTLTQTTPQLQPPPHEHDDRYSPAGHKHDDLYAPTIHSHPPPPPPIKVLAPTCFTVAAFDSLFAENAIFRCDGIHDEEQINEALALTEGHGAEVKLLDGTFVTDGPIIAKGDYPNLGGSGLCTKIMHGLDFPEDMPIVKFYNNDIRPTARAMFHDLMIVGNPNGTQRVHGVEWCSSRGLMENVHIADLRGRGLWTHNVPGASGQGWNAMEAQFHKLNIAGCEYGIFANSADQHYSNIVVHDSVIANLHGIFTGCMIDNSHFWAGAANFANAQTMDNVWLTGGQRTRISNTKIEHAKRRVLWVNGNPKGAFLTLDAVGIRNGSGEGVGLHPQMLVDKTGGNFSRILMSNCVFDADVSQPSWNVMIMPDAIRNSRIEGGAYDNALIGEVTPFGPTIGMLSTINRVGWSQLDPNVAPVAPAKNDWYGRGEKGLQVEAGGFLWQAKSATEWYKVCAI